MNPVIVFLKFGSAKENFGLSGWIKKVNSPFYSRKWSRSDGEMYHAFLDAPKYGNDDEYVDQIFLDVWLNTIKRWSPRRVTWDGLVPAALSNQFTWTIRSVTGATPDGRLAGVTACGRHIISFSSTDVKSSCNASKRG